MRGLEQQMELWDCAHDAAKDVYFDVWGSEYGTKVEKAKGSHFTEAVRSASNIANRYLKKGADAMANRVETERRTMENEIEKMRREIDVLSQGR